MNTRDKIIETFKTALLKHTHKVRYANDYPIEAVPKATILDMKVLVKDELEQLLSKEPLPPQQSEQEWVSVKDRLPNNEDSFIAYESTHGSVFCAELDGDNWYDLEAQCFVPPHQIITHWMPLPEPPKQDKG